MVRLNENGPWLGETGQDSDVVVSTRVRLARNIDGVPFVNQATDADRNEIVGMVRRTPLFAADDGELDWVEVDELDGCDRRKLVERHLISRQFADSEASRGVGISRDESLSVMVNEEDHLRIQTLGTGSMLHEAHERIAAINRELESHLDFAFNPRWGFLTACPTNVGCGVRFSVMLHLPGLRITEELERVRRAAKDLNLAVRGFHGEGSESTGDFFQISNQVTLGVSEHDLLETFAGDIVPRLVDYERSARQLLLDKRIRNLEDRVHRAHGILASARMLEANETINLLSRVRLGVALGILKTPSVKDVHRLLLHVQPAHVSSITNAPLEDNEASRVARAQMVRGIFGG